MSSGPYARPADVERVRAMYAGKAAEELRVGRAGAGQATASDAGRLDAVVLFAKGEVGPAEAAGLPVLAGPDGQAVLLALEALGFDPESWYATLVDADLPDDAAGMALRATIEAVDPYAVVALDPVAAHAVARAMGCVELRPGRITRSLGRTLLALEGLERSLDRPDLKRRVWGQLKALRPAPAPW